MTSKLDPVSLVPYGFVVTRSWLMDQGIGRHTVDNWLKSGQIIPVARGVCRRPDVNKLTWQGVVCSLQRMGSDLMPGGLTALTLLGMAHYLSPTAHRTVHLYGGDNLPGWADTLLPGTHFTRHSGKRLFRGAGAKCDVYTMKRDPAATHNQLSEFSTCFAWGPEEWPVAISTPERAILEVLLDVPKRISLEHAEHLLQGLPTLSPQRLSRLLECCTNVKVKRLFLWLAEKNKSPWLKRIDLGKFGMESGALGSGKRVIAKAGKLDPKYLITVPRVAS